VNHQPTELSLLLDPLPSPLQAVDWNRAAESGWANTNGFCRSDLEAALEDLAAAPPGCAGPPRLELRGSEPGPQGSNRAGVCRRTAGQGSAGPVAVGHRRRRGQQHGHSDLGIDVRNSGFLADWLVVDYPPWSRRGGAPSSPGTAVRPSRPPRSAVDWDGVGSSSYAAPA
jgi:hypothetical protein